MISVYYYWVTKKSEEYQKSKVSAEESEDPCTQFLKHVLRHYCKYMQEDHSLFLICAPMELFQHVPPTTHRCLRLSPSLQALCDILL